MRLIQELVQLLDERDVGHIPVEFTKDLAHSRAYAQGFKHGKDGGKKIDTSNMLIPSHVTAYDAGYEAGSKKSVSEGVQLDEGMPSKANAAEREARKRVEKIIASKGIKILRSNLVGGADPWMIEVQLVSRSKLPKLAELKAAAKPEYTHVSVYDSVDRWNYELTPARKGRGGDE